MNDLAKSSQTAPRKAKSTDHGKLKIGDDWNAIRIIALSQSNPLKAIAEFVENSIDANAKTITITRGREHGEHYLCVSDDGDGVPRDGDGRPNFWRVSTLLWSYLRPGSADRTHGVCIVHHKQHRACC
jgi:hypothetical protein